MDVNTDLLWATWKCIGKIISATGVIFVGISITPTGAFVRKEDNWFMRQRRWISEYPTRPNLGSPVVINPGLLYVGLGLSIVGIFIS